MICSLIISPISLDSLLHSSLCFDSEATSDVCFQLNLLDKPSSIATSIPIYTRRVKHVLNFDSA